MFVTNVDKFLKDGVATCKRHGLHEEWSYRPRRMKLKNGKIEHYKCVECRRCGREAQRKLREKDPFLMDKYRFSKSGSINRILLQAKSRAKKKKLPFELDKEWFLERLFVQNNKCAYSGLEFNFEPPKIRGENRFFHPSIDQLVAGKGYTKENSRLVGVGVNIMKYEMSLEMFIDVCKKIANYNK